MKADLRIALILLLAVLALTACVPKKTAVSPDAEKPVPAQSQPMSKMDPPFLYLAAQNAIKDGDPALATELLEALTTKDPAAIMPRVQLVELLLQRAQFDKAASHIGILQKNRDLTPEQLEVINLLQARILAGKGDEDAALATLDVFLKQHPQNVMARDLQVRILSGQQRIDEALAAIDTAIRSNDIAGFRLLQAQLLINKGDMEGAKSALLRLQQLAPDNDTAAQLLSSIAIRENKLELAENVLREFLAGHPDSLAVGNALGRLLAGQNRLAEAIMVYRDIATQTGNDPAVLQTLGLLYLQYEEYKQAEEVFRKLLESKADDSNRFYLAASLEAQERDDEARKTYALIGNKSPMFTDAQVRLAGMDFRRNDLNAAEKRAQSILKKSPGQLDAHLLLSAIRISQKRYRLLLDESEAILAEPKLPPQLLLNRAVAFDHFKDFKQSEHTLKRILKHNPDYSEALNFLGYTYAVQGLELSKAEALIKSALLYKPDDGYYMDSLAWVYYKKGEYDKALRTQKKALETVSDDAVMFEHFGDILWRADDREAARRAWQQSIDLKAENPKQLQRKIAEGLKESE